jgi:alkanesulfonate monooxygenase SsuD/methylene tetrahydromethanopterin reductase-like flavin-dependent oxidoreductase (luciferase family)
MVGALYAGGELTLKAFARAAESSGLDSVWCGDHLVRPVDGVTGLGVLVGSTERVDVGTAVLVAPLRAPAVLASAVLTAAREAGSERRVIAGVGAGGDDAADFAAVGAALGTRGARLEETLDLLATAVSGIPANAATSRVDGILNGRLPARPPEVWIGGRAPAALRRAARIGNGYVAYLVGPDQVKRRVERLHEHSAQVGRQWTGSVAAICFTVPGADRDRALAAASARPVLEGLRRDLYTERYLLGSEHDILARASAFLRAGVNHLILGFPPGDTDDLERFLAAAEAVQHELGPMASSESAGAR